MRLDRFLWFTRLTKTRGEAQAIALDGHLRIDGRPVARAAAAVAIGNVLSFPARGRICAIRIEAIPARRGPAAEARACYTDLLAEELGRRHNGDDEDVDDGGAAP